MSKRSNSRRIRGRGAVIIIAMLLISSAILRLGGGTGQAVAQALTQPVKSDAPLRDQSLPDTPLPPERRTAALDRAATSDLLEALRDREMRVEALEKQIEMRRKALEVADREITKRLETLETAEVNLRRTLALADNAAEEDLARLTTVYENMKPKDAAALFATMEPDFAAGFLGRMRPDAAAAVLTGIPPDVAYSISAILAGRNANVPKN